jgi:hypothetical protein
MKSAALGSGTSGPEVTNVSQHGLWLLLEREELFLSFQHFPRSMMRRFARGIGVGFNFKSDFSCST